MAEATTRKLQRDRMADEARARALAKDSTQEAREELQTLQRQLYAAMKEAGAAEARHKLESERLRRQIHRLQREVADLQEGLRAAEADRLRAWEAVQRAEKEVAEIRAGGNSVTAVQNRETWVESSPNEPSGVFHNGNGEQWSVQSVPSGTAPSSSSSSPRCASPLKQASSSEAAPWGSPSLTLGRAEAAAVPSEGCQRSTPTEVGGGSEEPESHDHGATRTFRKRSAAGQSPELQTPRSPAVLCSDAVHDPEVTRFPNGTVRRSWLDGHAVTSYGNGDVKQEYPSGIVEYFYKAVQCWQVTHVSGIEVFYFPGGRVEAHLPSGAKESLLDGGAGALHTLPGSSESVSVPHTMLCREVMAPCPVLLDRYKS